MLTIMVDGREEQLNMGCRSFVSLDELLKILAPDAARVTLNGEMIAAQGFGAATVKSGDALLLK